MILVCSSVVRCYYKVGQHFTPAQFSCIILIDNFTPNK